MKPTKPNKLQMLKPQVRMAGTPKVNVIGVGARTRGEGATARGYNYKFLSDNPLCCYCERTGRTTAANVVDHIIPHRGDQSLFWNESNWQPLCKPCHDSTKAKEEGRGPFKL